MKNKKLAGIKHGILLLLVLILLPVVLVAQKELAKHNVHTGDLHREHTFVHPSLDEVDLNLAEGRPVLYKIENREETEVASKLDTQGGPMFYWFIDQKLSIRYGLKPVLRHEPFLQDEEDFSIKVMEDGGDLIIASMVVLIRIQPPDHYHDVGLWNPWTYTYFKGEVIDFWNFSKAEGTVTSIVISSRTSNSMFWGFTSIHNHIDLNGKTKTRNEIALIVEWKVRVRFRRLNGWSIDFTSILNNPTGSVFKIIKYQYQGFGFQATEKWDDNTVDLLTSKGKNKSDGNSTRARWCNIKGVSEVGTSGVLFITHPANYNYTEPISIWPVGANGGKENVFFNFNPAVDRDWVLRPGIDYQLKYRMFDYDGEIEVKIA